MKPVTRFNGAAADQPRKGSMSWTEYALSGCFNGAAADQPRKGRGATGTWCCAAGASMGPRLISRGKRQAGQLGERPVIASMGPRLISRGKAPGT